MKDSQRLWSEVYLQDKYIKESNERFSTNVSRFVPDE